MRTKAVFFDMYETLITHYRSPLYFGAEMAKDAGISVNDFFRLWRDPIIDHDRTIGKITLEELLCRILKENNRYDETLVNELVSKRTAVKEECFRHLHDEIIPLLTKLKKRNIRIVLVSNCYLEEAKVIRESLLFPFFDRVCLSCEEGIAKPDKEIFLKAVHEFSLKPEECLYVGDGGSRELETAAELGMNPVQAVWYLLENTSQPSKRKPGFIQAESPLDVLNYLKH